MALPDVLKVKALAYPWFRKKRSQYLWCGTWNSCRDWSFTGIEIPELHQELGLG